MRWRMSLRVGVAVNQEPFTSGNIEEDEVVGVVDVVGEGLPAEPVAVGRMPFGDLLVVDTEVAPEQMRVLRAGAQQDPVGRPRPVQPLVARSRARMSRCGSSVISSRAVCRPTPARSRARPIAAVLAEINGQISVHRVMKSAIITALPRNAARSVRVPSASVSGMSRIRSGKAPLVTVPIAGKGGATGWEPDEQLARPRTHSAGSTPINVVRRIVVTSPSDLCRPDPRRRLADRRREG